MNPNLYRLHEIHEIERGLNEEKLKQSAMIKNIIHILYQQTSPKHWFGNMTMASNCDVTSSTPVVVILVSLLAIRKILHCIFIVNSLPGHQKKTVRLSSQVSLNKLTLKTHLGVERAMQKDN